MGIERLASLSQATFHRFGGIAQVSVDTGAVAQYLRFPDQWFQSETGLHQNWHRDYDPTTGRYLQADALGLVDGASVYGYAAQHPMGNVDPEGLFLSSAGRGLTLAGRALGIKLPARIAGPLEGLQNGGLVGLIGMGLIDVIERLYLVWMAPAGQDLFCVNGVLSDAVLCPAFRRGAHDRWP